MKFVPLLLSIALVCPAAQSTTLEQLIDEAIRSDDLNQQLALQQKALAEQSQSVDTLPDPTISLSMANLPTDGFDLNQEPMTQVIVGVSQALPRGDSRAIAALIKRKESAIKPNERDVRAAKLTMLITQQWAKLAGTSRQHDLIKDANQWLEQLITATESRYASAKSGIRQRDILAAQLQQAQLTQDTLAIETSLQQQIASFYQWSALPILTSDLANTELNQLDETLATTSKGLIHLKDETQLRILMQHPEFRVLDSEIDVSRYQIQLAEQDYAPQWKFNASYGLRQDDDAGNSRADFVSIGVAVSMPLFSAKRQDYKVSALQYQTESKKTYKRLVLRQKLSEWKTLAARLEGIQRREFQFQDTIIPQYQGLLDSLTASYANDRTDLTEVIRAKVDLVAAERQLVNLQVSKIETMAALNYFSPQILTQTQEQ